MFVSSYLSCPELAVVSAVLRDGASLVRLYPLPKLVSRARAPRMPLLCLLQEDRSKPGGRPVSLGDRCV